MNDLSERIDFFEGELIRMRPDLDRIQIARRVNEIRPYASQGQVVFILERLLDLAENNLMLPWERV